MADEQAPLRAGDHSQQDRPLDPERLLRLAGLVRAVLDELRQMPPDQASTAELAALYERVAAQVGEGLPNMLRQELEAIDLAQPMKDGASPQEIRVAYAGLIGWLSGLFQGLQAAMQFHQLQAGHPALANPVEPGMATPDRTGQYL